MTHCLNASKVILNALTSFDLRILAKVSVLNQITITYASKPENWNVEKTLDGRKETTNASQLTLNARTLFNLRSSSKSFSS